MFAGGISGGAKTSAELPLFRELDGLVAVSKAGGRGHSKLRV